MIWQLSQNMAFLVMKNFKLTWQVETVGNKKFAWIRESVQQCAICVHPAYNPAEIFIKKFDQISKTKVSFHSEI